jgi:hypothetical protein
VGLQRSTFVEAHVHESYWERDINCAWTTLEALSHWFDLPIHQQVFDAALGMHGAGGYRAQCGLIEGALMFLGLTGRAHGIVDKEIVAACYRFAAQFESHFGSLSCRELRPQGFAPDNPPHLCEGLTCETILFDMAFVGHWLASAGAAER